MAFLLRRGETAAKTALALWAASCFAFLGQLGLGACLGMNGAFLDEPRRGCLQQCGDLRRGEWIGDVGAVQATDGNVQFLGDHGARVRSITAQILEPGRRGFLQNLELLPADRVLLEFHGSGGQVNAQLLGRGGGFHCLGGRFNAHTSKGTGGRAVV